MFLLLAGLLLAENRSLRAWAVLVPVLVLSSIPLAFTASAPKMTQFLTPGMWALIVGPTCAWLLFPRLVTSTRTRSVVAFALTTILAGLTVPLGENLPGLTAGGYAPFVAASVPLLFLGLVMALGLGGAGVMCARRCTTRRLFAWIVVSFLVLPPLVLGPIALCVVHAAGFGSTGITSLVTTVFGAAAAGLAALGILLPFLVLTFTSELYRTRFAAVFHLATPAGPLQQNGLPDVTGRP